jgi:putative FmdB family regulatory protein
MPIYEYKCETCGKTLEAIQKFSDAPLTECGCHGRLKRLISSSSFHLKGSGWYVTDYKGKDTASRTSGKESGEKSHPVKSDSTPKKSEAKSSTSSAE